MDTNESEYGTPRDQGTVNGVRRDPYGRPRRATAREYTQNLRRAAVRDEPLPGDVRPGTRSA